VVAGVGLGVHQSITGGEGADDLGGFPGLDEFGALSRLHCDKESLDCLATLD
jgi:hypothetical protein